MKQHTYKFRIALTCKTNLPVEELYPHVHVFVCIVCAKQFVYNSCLFVACTLTVGRIVKVSKS